MGRAQGQTTAAASAGRRDQQPAADGARKSLKPVAELTHEELAQAIRSRLRHLEADKEWNKHEWTDGKGAKHSTSHLYGASAVTAPGGKIRIVYVSYQGSSTLERGQAEDYLTWLRAGNRGPHFAADQDGAIRKTKKESEADAYKVAYRADGRYGYGSEVYSEVFVPEDSPHKLPAEDIAAGDKVYFQGRWRQVEGTEFYAPPEPEELHKAQEQIRDATLRGDYKALEQHARALQGLARQFDAGRELEVTLTLSGHKTLRLTPEAQVGIKRPAAPPAAETA